MPTSLPPLSREKLKNLRSAASARIRRRKRMCFVEGERALEEARASGFLDYLVFSGEGGAAGRMDPDTAGFPGIPGFTLEGGSFSRLSDVRAGTGVIGAARIPPGGKFPTLVERKGPSTLVFLDGLQDPGNVGGIIRSGWAFGIQGVLLGRGTADPFSPKGVRASAGGVFHLPLYHGITEADLEELAESGYTISLAQAGGADLGTVPFGPHSILALGSEGHGFSKAVRAMGQPVSVPMVPGVDSLNVVVAGSIILAEMVK